MQAGFAGGAFALFEPGQQTLLHPHIVAPEGRIHFAGEHASQPPLQASSQHTPSTQKPDRQFVAIEQLAPFACCSWG